MLEYSKNIKLLTEYPFGYLNLKGGCAGLSESIHVKMPLCWKSHVAAQLLMSRIQYWMLIAGFECLRCIGGSRKFCLGGGGCPENFI